MCPFLWESDSTFLSAIQCLNKSLRTAVSKPWNKRSDCYVSWDIGSKLHPSVHLSAPHHFSKLFLTLLNPFRMYVRVLKSYLYENIECDFLIFHKMEREFRFPILFDTHENKQRLLLVISSLADLHNDKIVKPGTASTGTEPRNLSFKMCLCRAIPKVRLLETAWWHSPEMAWIFIQVYKTQA